MLFGDSTDAIEKVVAALKRPDSVAPGELPTRRGVTLRCWFQRSAPRLASTTSATIVPTNSPAPASVNASYGFAEVVRNSMQHHESDGHRHAAEGTQAQRGPAAFADVPTSGTRTNEKRGTPTSFNAPGAAATVSAPATGTPTDSATATVGSLRSGSACATPHSRTRTSAMRLRSCR